MTLINVDSTIHEEEILTAAAAARRLGVKRETLYAYASRGLLRRVPLGRGRASGYVRADVERLKARSDARAGHGAVASGALRWGEPVLDSAITSIDAGGPAYRGHYAVDLARAGKTFEEVAELLWSGALPAARPDAWQPMPLPAAVRALARRSEGAPLIARQLLLVTALGIEDEARLGASREAELARARRLIARLSLGTLDRPGGAIADNLLAMLGARARRQGEARRAIDCALVVLADHELNASSFAARVAAGAGADLYACMCAALATASGPRHGGECDRVEAMVREARRPAHAADAVAARLRRGEAVPGFGHPLYAAGDPRAAPLFDAACAISEKRTATVVALARAMKRATGLLPTVDTSLVAVALALGAPPGTAAGIFALGRTAGWVAHALEQREAGYLLRPRARYVGVPATRAP